jgi:predicted S18 family serine protease
LIREDQQRTGFEGSIKALQDTQAGLQGQLTAITQTPAEVQRRTAAELESLRKGKEDIHALYLDMKNVIDLNVENALVRNEWRQKALNDLKAAQTNVTTLNTTLLDVQRKQAEFEESELKKRKIERSGMIADEQQRQEIFLKIENGMNNMADTFDRIIEETKDKIKNLHIDKPLTQAERQNLGEIASIRTKQAELTTEKDRLNSQVLPGLQRQLSELQQLQRLGTSNEQIASALRTMGEKEAALNAKLV